MRVGTEVLEPQKFFEVVTVACSCQCCPRASCAQLSSPPAVWCPSSCSCCALHLALRSFHPADVACRVGSAQFRLLLLLLVSVFCIFRIRSTLRMRKPFHCLQRRFCVLFLRCVSQSMRGLRTVLRCNFRWCTSAHPRMRHPCLLLVHKLFCHLRRMSSPHLSARFVSSRCG